MLFACGVENSRLMLAYFKILSSLFLVLGRFAYGASFEEVLRK